MSDIIDGQKLEADILKDMRVELPMSSTRTSSAKRSLRMRGSPERIRKHSAPCWWSRAR